MAHKTFLDFMKSVQKEAGRFFDFSMPRLPGQKHYYRFTGKSHTFKKNRRRGL